MSIRLRQIRDADFQSMQDMMSDYDTVKMTSTWPWPADPDFTRMRMKAPEMRDGRIQVIEVDGHFAGTIGLKNGDLAYTLLKDFWGRGIMTKAVSMMIDRGFQDETRDRITASAWDDNPGSMRVMVKCGMRELGRSEGFCKARNADLGAVDFAIDRGDWISGRQIP